MEVFIIGLIVYVILSVIGEMVKKGKNAPPAQTGGGKPVPFPYDPAAKRKTFQDVLRETLEEAGLEGKDAKDDAAGEYRYGDGYQGEGSSAAFGEGADSSEAEAWPPQRDGSLTSGEMMPAMDDAPFTVMEGAWEGTESGEGFSSEGLGSLEGFPATDGSLGEDTRWGSLGPIPEEERSSESLPKASMRGEEFSRWEQEDVEDIVDFADGFLDTTESGFSYEEVSFSDSGSNASPMFLRRGLLTSEDDLLSGIIVSEILNAPGGKSRLVAGARRQNRIRIK